MRARNVTITGVPFELLAIKAAVLAQVERELDRRLRGATRDDRTAFTLTVILGADEEAEQPNTRRPTRQRSTK